MKPSMSFYDRRRPNDYGGGGGGGPVMKKPRMNMRMPNVMGPSYGQDDDKRLISFKEFVLQQHDGIEEDQACKLYNDYKLDFKRRQMEKFFEQHKDEEWFRNKYRPPERDKLKEHQKNVIEERKKVYNQLLDRQLTEGIRMAYEDHDKIYKFLENFSLMLEGATIEEVIDGTELSKYATSCIFIPHLHPSIDKTMIEDFAKTHEEFLRVSIAEPHVDKLGFKIRAWVTYKHMSQEKLQDICWEFNRQKFNGHETKAYPNKELENRIRTSPYWFRHKKCVVADIKQVAKILTHFEKDECPLLETIKDYLIEETNGEEKVLLESSGEPEFQFEQDENMLKALDKIILYLRVVYSFDYYAVADFTGEHDTPQRIGLIFTRQQIPPTTFEAPHKTLKEFIEAQDLRLKAFFDKPIVSAEDLKFLGYRNPEEQIENFIYQHTHEIRPGKYECKITKKKFVQPEFVRKHMLNKCTQQLDDVKHDTEFFNNYIADTKRPL